MSQPGRFEKQRIAGDLEEVVEEANALARKLGLEPYPVNYWVVDYDEMNELMAYGGFQSRYPHWRWGMQYDRNQKRGQYGMGKAFEIVNNDDPANAFLQESNTMADQKAVITHVEAHSDFFANNEWYGMFDDGVQAAAMLERHADAIADYMSDPSIDRDEVEKWIDHALALEDNIDQYRSFGADRYEFDEYDDPSEADDDVAAQLDELELSEEVREQVFDDEWLEGQQEEAPARSFPEEPEKDLLGFLRAHGKQYDEEASKAVEMEEWQRDVLEMLRAEAYYFAPQKMTKIMNEGWASYWESKMMADEGFADADEFMTYADHMAKVLGSPGLNPYKLGLELWQYVENTTNREEVLDKLLRVEGVSWRNFGDVVDVDRVLELLEPPAALRTPTSENLDAIADLEDRYVDRENLERAREGEIDVDRYPWKVLSYEGLVRRHFSLLRPQFRGFLGSVTQSELERIGRYMFESDRYESVEAAVADVDYEAGWRRMYEIRESHNDVTFLDEFLTQEFVDENEYFTYEYSQAAGQFRVSSTDYEDVKRKLLLQFTNFGKPTITVRDGNYDNRNELLLAHHYNGVMLDLAQAKRTLERVFELWGRPVNLMTVVKQVDEHDVEVAKRRDKEPEPEETGMRIRYDGDRVEMEEVAWDRIEDLGIVADDVDYDTKPEEWLA